MEKKETLLLHLLKQQHLQTRETTSQPLWYHCDHFPVHLRLLLLQLLQQTPPLLQALLLLAPMQPLLLHPKLHLHPQLIS